ncbi:MAG: NAD(P)/FAD-dependent oxidoreductase [Planctomycetaceae bacterium]
MRLAIIGSGISGLVCAHRLCQEHDITLFESGDYLGGHTNTIDVELDGEHHAVDTGFIVFNDWTYPNFIALLNELGVASQPTSMSFSVQDGLSGLEYNGTSLNGLFAQRRNLFRPAFYRMLKDILRFNREAPAVLEAEDSEQETVATFLAKHDYSTQFVRHYLLPMGAAIWSCPPTTFEQFPIRFIVEFYRNHGILNLWNRPTWRVINGGSRTYVEAIRRQFQGTIHLNTPIMSAERFSDRVELTDAQQRIHSFDEVIFACHSDQALTILRDASPTERELLTAFPYEPNTAVLHTDISVLPKRKRAWAAWNYRLHSGGVHKATVTYNMNILQHIDSSHTFCVTLNDTTGIDESKVLRRIQYAHPIFTTNRAAAQQRHQDVIRKNRTSFCGAYWGYGFHEDGVKSAINVCRAFDSSTDSVPPGFRRKEASHA